MVWTRKRRAPVLRALYVQMNIEGTPPPKNIPVIWGDYNAIGLSGEADDNCIYSLHRDVLKKIDPKEGEIVFVYEDDLDEKDNP